MIDQIYVIGCLEQRLLRPLLKVGMFYRIRHIFIRSLAGLNWTSQTEFPYIYSTVKSPKTAENQGIFFKLILV